MKDSCKYDDNDSDAADDVGNWFCMNVMTTRVYIYDCDIGDTDEWE